MYEGGDEYRSLDEGELLNDEDTAELLTVIIGKFFWASGISRIF